MTDSKGSCHFSPFAFLLLPLFEHLDTSFINVAALLRYLQQRAFVGRIHVVLDEYEADVLLGTDGTTLVRELDYATGRRSESADAIQRLLVRAREPGGLVSVYEGAAEAATIDAGVSLDANAEAELTPESEEWRDLLRVSGEVIAAVERAVLSARADFAGLFRATRLELADDFSFLDPSTRRFDYANATARLHAGTGMKAYVAGLCECLRRVVEKTARGGEARRVRERVALELAVLARRRQALLARFNLSQQFDRIAGTRVL
jgi:hypothetical protein